MNLQQDRGIENSVLKGVAFSEEVVIYCIGSVLPYRINLFVFGICITIRQAYIEMLNVDFLAYPVPVT